MLQYYVSKCCMIMAAYRNANHRSFGKNLNEPLEKSVFTIQIPGIKELAGGSTILTKKGILRGFRINSA